MKTLFTMVRACIFLSWARTLLSWVKLKPTLNSIKHLNKTLRESFFSTRQNILFALHIRRNNIQFTIRDINVRKRTDVWIQILDMTSLSSLLLLTYLPSRILEKYCVVSVQKVIEFMIYMFCFLLWWMKLEFIDRITNIFC